MINKLKIGRYNLILFILVIISIVFGILVVNSANSAFTKKNIFGAILAITIMIALSFIDYRKYLNYDWILYIINLLVLIAVKLPYIGHVNNNARRWINLGITQIQPSEISKLVLIIFVASYIHKHKDYFNTFATLFKLAVLIAVPLALIVTQPDLSTTVLTTLVLFTVIFVGGLSLKLIAIVSSLLIPLSVAFLWYVQQPWQKLLRPWQQRRILSFLHPGDYINTESYQQFNSILAIGSGKLVGNGLNNHLPSSVKNGNYLPYPQTDFIFAIVGEDLGFVGTAFTLGLLLTIVVLLLYLSYNLNELYAKLIVVGVAAYIGLQTFINIGVVTMILPNTGLPLPFISYGLTSLTASCMMIGVVLNISRQKQELYS